MNNFRDFLPPDSADAVITAMVRAILLGYDDAAARFDPTVGCDPNTFGTETWRFIWYRLERELATVPGVETTRAESSFGIIIGDLVIRCYRGGPDEQYDINEFDFGGGSRLRRETPWRNSEQLNLFTQASEVEVEVEQPVILTIVHTGNPDKQCTGIWVGMPFPEGWRWVDHIFDMDLVAEEEPPAGGFSRFDEQDEPDVWVDLREDDETEEEPEVEDQEKPDDGEEQAEDDKGS